MSIRKDNGVTDSEYFRLLAAEQGYAYTPQQVEQFCEYVTMLTENGMATALARSHAMQNIINNELPFPETKRLFVLFIQNIPAETTHAELTNFVEKGLKRLFLFRTADICKLEILTIRNLQNQHLEYHGLAYIDSYTAGIAAIEILKTKKFKNCTMQVREFKQRFAENDRRAIPAPEDYPFPQRIADRRREQNIEILHSILDAAP